MAIKDKNDDGQVQTAIEKELSVMETPSEVYDIKSDLRIDSVSDTNISRICGNIISGSCTLDAVDDDDVDYSLSANYEIEIDEDGETISVEYTDIELME